MTIEKAVLKIIKHPSSRPKINHYNGVFTLRVGEVNCMESIILMLDDIDITSISVDRNLDELCDFLYAHMAGHETKYKYGNTLKS